MNKRAILGLILFAAAGIAAICFCVNIINNQERTWCVSEKSVSNIYLNGYWDGMNAARESSKRTHDCKLSYRDSADRRITTTSCSWNATDEVFYKQRTIDSLAYMTKFKQP